jgi:AAA domain-containing protein
MPEEPVSRKLSTRRPDEILAMVFDESDRIVGDRIIAKGQNACIVGPAGLGKSRLTLQMAVANLAGRSFIGLESRPVSGPWLFVQAENSNRRLQDDLKHFQAWVGEKAWPAVNAGLVIHTLEQDYDGFLSLGNDANRKSIRELNGDHKPSVSVYDCLSNFSASDLNNDSEMLATCSLLAEMTRTGAPDRVPLILHHARTGRQAAIGAVGIDKSSYGRSSKALLGWTRSQINLAPGDDSGELIVVGCGKCSNGKPFTDFAVRLNQKTMIYEVEEDFDFVAWRSEMSRTTPPVITAEEITALCNGGKTKAELVSLILRSVDCAEGTAYRHIKKAEKRKFIRLDKASQRYVVAV